MYIHHPRRVEGLAQLFLKNVHPSIHPRRRAQLFIEDVYPSKEKSWTTSIHRRRRAWLFMKNVHTYVEKWFGSS
jgi:hypothetical protein